MVPKISGVNYERRVFVSGGWDHHRAQHSGLWRQPGIICHYRDLSDVLGGG